jgi:hypothetical protein
LSPDRARHRPPAQQHKHMLTIHMIHTGAGEDNGVDHNNNGLRFPYDSTFLRSQYLHPHPYISATAAPHHHSVHHCRAIGPIALTLRSAVGDGPPMRRGGEWPAAAAGVTEVAPPHRGRLKRVSGGGSGGVAAQDLSPLKEGVRTRNHRGELGAEASCVHGLHREGRIPALAAVVALHLHTILRDPLQQNQAQL